MKKLLLVALAFAGLSAASLNAQEKHELLIEQFTTERCGYCPGGTQQINNAAQAMTMTDTIHVSRIAHHAGFGTDFLTVPESQQLLHLYRIGGGSGTFAPAFMLNRFKLNNKVVHGVSTANVNTIAEKVMNAPKQAAVHLSDTDMSYDVNTRVLKMKVYSNALPAYAGGEDDFFINVALTEDNIKAQNQSGGGSNYIHNAVLRKLLAGAKGFKVNPGYGEAEFEFTLPATWKVENMKVIVFAHAGIGSGSSLPANPVVYDSKEFPFPATGTSISTIADKNMKVYAVDGNLTIEGDYLNAIVYDLNGRLVKATKLMPGVYVVKVETHTGSYVHKVVVK